MPVALILKIDADFANAIRPICPMKDDVVEAAHERQRLSVLHKQLILSLKFHHSQTLEQIPLEMAVQAMIEVWQACNPSQSSKR